MWFFWVVLPLPIILGLSSFVGGIAGMVLQREARVTGPSNVSYRVVVGPSGIPWVAAFNWDAGWITLPFHWVRYLRRRPRTWSVTMTETKSWWIKPKLVNEEYPTRREAQKRFIEVAEQVERGQLVPDVGG